MTKITRPLLALLAWSALLGSTALAAPPGGIGVSVGAGAHGGIGVGAPPAGVPPAQVPPANVPPVSVPKPQASALPASSGTKAAASVHANAQSSLVAGDVMHGTVTGVSGTAVTIALGDGTTHTYNVSAQSAARLQSYLHKQIAFHVQNGTLALVGRGTPPLRGMVQSVNGTTALIKLAGGTAQTYTVSASQAAWLQAHTGKTVVFWANGNGTIELNERFKTSHRQSGSRN